VLKAHNEKSSNEEIFTYPSCLTYCIGTVQKGVSDAVQQNHGRTSRFSKINRNSFILESDSFVTDDIPAVCLMTPSLWFYLLSFATCCESCGSDFFLLLVIQK
jgi:hypothetical protein